MGKVVITGSMSLDGFGAGPDISEQAPMGVGGERLHQWMFGEETGEFDAAMSGRMRAAAGAVVLGRRTFDIGVDIWGDVPFPAPSFVVTHSPREDLPQKSGTFVFVADLATAVQRAKEASSSGDVLVMGGGTIIGETLRAGLADEVWVQLVPVLLGAGNPMFPAVTGVELKLVEHAASPSATHLRYLVVR